MTCLPDTFDFPRKLAINLFESNTHSNLFRIQAANLQEDKDRLAARTRELESCLQSISKEKENVDSLRRESLKENYSLVSELSNTVSIFRNFLAEGINAERKLQNILNSSVVRCRETKYRTATARSHRLKMKFGVYKL